MRLIAHAAAGVLLAIAGLAGLGGAPAAAADEVPWTVATAANDFGSDRSNYSYTVDPGEQVEDGLVVVNHGTTPLDLAVYSADAFTTATGRLDLVAKDAKSTGVGTWVHSGLDHVTVQPGQSADVPFTVAVPAGAASGDHLGGIVTSLRAGDVERRVGIRLRVRVGADLTPGLSVENARVQYSGSQFGRGDATVSYTIRNTGNAILAARQAVSVSGPFGSWRAPGRVDDSPQLLPGETWQVSVPVHGVAPAVRLAASVTLTPLLTDAAGSTAPLATIEATAHGWAIPWVVLLALVAGCVVVVAFSRRRRRVRAQEPVTVG
jgi:hypothetical protein